MYTCIIYIYMYMYMYIQIFIYFSKPLRLLYSLIIYEIVNFSFFALYSLLFLYFFLYLKSVPIYVIVHVHCTSLMRDKKVEGSKETIRLKVKQTNYKAKQQSTLNAVTFPKKKIAASGGTRTHNTLHSTRICIRVYMYKDTCKDTCKQHYLYAFNFL